MELLAAVYYINPTVVPLFLWNAFDLAAPTTTTTTRLLDFNRINIVKLFSPFMTVLLAAAGASPVGINRERGIQIGSASTPSDSKEERNNGSRPSTTLYWKDHFQ